MWIYDKFRCWLSYTRISRASLNSSSSSSSSSSTTFRVRSYDSRINLELWILYRQSVGLLRRGSALSQGRCLQRTTQTQNEWGQICMPRGGFEPTIPVFERAKTFHALDSAATVIGPSKIIASKGECVACEQKRTKTTESPNSVVFYFKEGDRTVRSR
jgi:hypothetical protein